ncbi:hypothetical protein [Corynebacterium lactis]|uniref:Uncharacterized protein n=1 Tax=Corynebacterium lactis RW2-5 TaxID=1408189 RepID=A0A0K2H0H4_9CORY|nr:hypothetical protein [Corynebacterium lactis]ALA67547.1 hypothetical protein CLAC_07160 [Corynebacterium lactis RW2-5]
MADLRAAIADGTTPGDFFVAGGQQLTACTVGDGYALHIVAAANNTSCEFAQEVMRVQTRELNPTNDNIRDHLSPNIEAKSPITQELYNVNCGEDSSGVITCTGGNNAKIYMY